MRKRHRPCTGLDRWLCVAVMLCLAWPAAAATYRVAPGGDDGNPGTAAAPWATLQRAADRVAPGDEVVVADGEYSGFWLRTSGTEAAPIVFRAEGSGAVIVNPYAPDGPGIALENVGWVTLEGFRVTDPPGAGIMAVTVDDGTSPGIVLRRNVVEGAGTNGGAACIVLVAGIDALVEENVVHGCQGAGISLAGGDATVVQNNVVYDVTGDGIRVLHQDFAAGPTDVVVVNNTVHVPETGGWALHFAAGGAAGCDGNVAFNNILLSDNPATGSVAIDATVGFASARNAAVDRFSADDGTTVIALAAFQATSPERELGSLISEPIRLFVDASLGDYRIRAGCPAVDGGVPELDGHPAAAVDIRGTRRPVGIAPDLGAYEFCAGWTCDSADADADADGGTDADADADADVVEDARPDGSTGDDDGGGCGCRSSDVSGGAWPWLATAVAGAALRLRRRRGS